MFKQQPTQKEKAPVLIPTDAKHSVLVADKSKHNKQTTFLIYLSRNGSVKIAKHTLQPVTSTKIYAVDSTPLVDLYDM